MPKSWGVGSTAGVRGEVAQWVGGGVRGRERNKVKPEGRHNLKKKNLERNAPGTQNANKDQKKETTTQSLLVGGTIRNPLEWGKENGRFSTKEENIK